MSPSNGLTTLSRSPTLSCSSTSAFGGANFIVHTTSGKESSGAFSMSKSSAAASAPCSPAWPPIARSSASARASASAAACRASMYSQCSRISRSSCWADSTTAGGRSPSQALGAGGGGVLALSSLTRASLALADSSCCPLFASDPSDGSILCTKLRGNQPSRLGLSSGRPKAQLSVTMLSCRTSPARRPSVAGLSRSSQSSST
mmetsp:Transcript_4914/g.14293  ORF Transcript_4914/g.14293 Transcript_4914/m.14293 type:complete len:203 (+) Transcript_4914:241-849(+)